MHALDSCQVDRTGHYPPGASFLAAGMEMEMDTTTTPPAEIRVSERTTAQKMPAPLKCDSRFQRPPTAQPVG
jgi:hypothetical protein